MTHLYIEQNTGLTEEVNSSIISKLYELAISGDLDETSDLKGRLHSTTARDAHVAYLNANYSDLYISADNIYITFADPEVDRVLSQTWGDGTGITLATLSTKTRISTSMFRGNTVIETFDELGQFDNITILENECFRDATNLRSIDLQNIVSIGTAQFYGTSLQGVIYMPNLQGNLYSGVFAGTNITEVSDLGSCISIDGSFQNCTQLESVTLPQTCTRIYNNSFYGCTQLQHINLESTVQLGNAAFSNCQNLQMDEINFPNLELLGGNGTFLNCKKIKHVVDLGKITEIPVSYTGCFENCTGLLDATLPDTLTSINTAVFRGCTNLNWIKLLSGTLPTYSHTDAWGRTNYYCFGEKWTNEVYSGQTYPIYVKDELLSQYQTADGWKDVGPNRLRPLSQFTTDFPNG